jgi:DNA polymerase-3 subunit delta
MRLRAEQLHKHLAQTAPAPVYLVCGDEPLQALECADAVRQSARRAGAEERIVIDAGTGFDWTGLGAATGNLSLFATRRLIDLRLGTATPGSEGGQALRNYVSGASGEDILLVTAARLDGRAQRSAWFEAIDKVGVVVQVWPIAPAQLPAWVQARAATRRLELPGDAAALVADRSEGNLLAAAQEIEKLALLQAAGPLDAETIRSAVMDCARFDPYDAIDAALAGDAARAVRIIQGLAAAGTEAIVVSWAFDREIRAGAICAEAMATGATLEQALEQAQVWQKRRGLVGLALRRHTPRAWRRLSRLCARLDRVTKGAQAGDAWSDLQWLSLALAGRGAEAIESALLS